MRITTCSLFSTPLQTNVLSSHLNSSKAKFPACPYRRGIKIHCTSLSHDVETVALRCDAVIWSLSEIESNICKAFSQQMFRFLRLKLNTNATASSPPIFSLSLRSFSTTVSNTTNLTQITIDYLTDSLEFSQESALKIAKRIDLKTLTKPNSVLVLFKSYGFTQTHITSIISKTPSLLVADSDKTLKPKLDFLAHNLISGRTLADIISNDSNILRSSLVKTIIPSLGLLKSFFRTNDELVSHCLAKHGTRVLSKFSQTMKPNISTLRHLGVPSSNISWTMRYSWVLYRDAEEFSKIVGEVKEMGFDPKNMRFIRAVCAVFGMRKDKWVSKLEAFKSFGWAEELVLSLFVKEPRVMISSEEQIKKALDFFLNKLEWTKDDIANYPVVLHLSLEKRIVPRSCVLQLLLSKGLVKSSCVGNAYNLPEDKFLDRFLVKYEKKIPGLLQMYQNKMGV